MREILLLGRSVKATAQERKESLPGDDLIPNAAGSLTHAVTLRRPRVEVWPWLVQMGAGRAGWYSYDLLDNGGQPSAERIVPELQHAEPGTLMPGLPGVKEGFIVLRSDAESRLVLGWPQGEGQPPMVTWAFILKEPVPETTRLIVRARGRPGYRAFGLPPSVSRLVVRLPHFIMQRRQLLGLARRVEGARGASLLERFIPKPEVTARHEILIRAPAEIVMDVARNMDMQSVPPFRFLIRMRGFLLRAGRQSPRKPVGFIEEIESLGWGRLAQEPGRHYAAGAACKPWIGEVVFRPLPPENFTEWAEPDHIKIAWTIEAQPLGPDVSTFVSETRVVATDEPARKKFARYWRFYGKGVVWIRWAVARAVRREAERRRRNGKPR